MCGIIGIVAKKSVNQPIYDALCTIQHRGQDAAGIMTCHESRLYLRKSNGLVREVMQTHHMLRLQGTMGIGHVRYPTAGSASAAEAQPLYVNSPYGLSIVHNGNLVNAQALKKNLLSKNLRHINTYSDSEILLNVFAHELQTIGKEHFSVKTLFKAVSKTHARCVGAYAAIIMIAGQGILAMRDPHGIRPLVYGKRETTEGPEYMVASETVALNNLSFTDISDVQPGEAIFIDTQGNLHQQECAKQTQLSPCLFEYVYLARPDSIIDSILVYKMRLRMGELLAEKIKRTNPNHGIDVVIPIPESSRSSALPLAQRLGVKYREGFVKNRYIGRTFIMPGQTQRKKSVRQKLNAIAHEMKDKNILLVDDSIVRGTTSREIIQMARDAGAKKVYFASAAPEVRFPNVYGIDMPSADELIAHDRDVEEITQSIGADWLIYQDLDALYEAAKEGNPTITRFEDSVFTGDYITGGVDQSYLEQQAKERSDSAKQTKLPPAEVLEVYNE